MPISDVAAVSGFTGEVGRASPRVLNAIKTKASKHPQMLKQITSKSSAKTSNYTKGFARKAYTIQLTPADTSYGPTYAKPR
jgi:hypothetical protein